MHVLLTIVILVVTLKYGDHKNLRNYGFTLYYVIICNLLYNVICSDYLLWEYNPDLLLNTRLNVELLYTFIILPGISFLYLSYFPHYKSKGKLILYLVKWVSVSLLIEFMFIKMDLLFLQNGYKFWMEFIFYPIMYVMIYVHYKKAVLSYILSIFIIYFMVWYFNVPIK